MSEDTLKILLLLVIALFAILMLKTHNLIMSSVVSLATITISLLFLSKQLQDIIEFVTDLRVMSGIDGKYIEVILKSLGISYIAEFTSMICKDCNENSLAETSELLGKIGIICLSLPLYNDVLNLILKIWEKY